MVDGSGQAGESAGMLQLSLSLLFGMAASGSVPASDSTDPSLVLERAVEVLLERQEHYVPDPRVGRLPDAELGAWQAKERERLAGLRAEAGPGAEWPYEGVYRVKGAIPAGYRVGGTAIACLALFVAPEGLFEAERRAAIERGLDFVLEELETNPDLRPGPKRGYDVRGWGHAYALRLLLTAQDEDAIPEAEAQRVAGIVTHLIACLEENTVEGGGWNYANDKSASPFMTASTLLTLYHARARGQALPEGMVDQALDALERGRGDNGAYAYSGDIGRSVAMPGSSARSAAAELALHLAGRSDPVALSAAVEGFFEGWDELYARKSQQGTHEGDFGIAPYYFFFGHTYAAAAIEALPGDVRAAQRERLRELILRTRGADGAWNDRVFPRSSSYSTAMVILALTAPTRPNFLPWSE